MSFSVDTSVLNNRLLKFKNMTPQLIFKMLMAGHDILRPEIDRYVSGPYNPSGKGPGTGSVPIPRVSTRLSRSFVTIKGKNDISIVSKGSIAPHNVFVHFGTKRMQARRFIQDPIEQNTEKIINKWEDMYRKELAKG